MSTEYTIRRIIVVPASYRDALNGAAMQFDPVGGERTFTTGLSPTGEGSPTHYVCNAAFRELTWNAIEADLLPQYPEAAVFDGSAIGLDGVLSALGLKRMVEGA